MTFPVAKFRGLWALNGYFPSDTGAKIRGGKSGNKPTISAESVRRVSADPIVKAVFQAFDPANHGLHRGHLLVWLGLEVGVAEFKWSEEVIVNQPPKLHWNMKTRRNEMVHPGYDPMTKEAQHRTVERCEFRFFHTGEEDRSGRIRPSPRLMSREEVEQHYSLSASTIRAYYSEARRAVEAEWAELTFFGEDVEEGEEQANASD